MGKFYYDNGYRGIHQEGRLYDRDNDLVYYTDGACFNNGYANAVSGCGVYGGPDMRLSFRNPDDNYDQCNTNNFAELHAIKGALEWHNENYTNHNAVIITDSQYSINCIENWSQKWMNRAVNGVWYNSNGGRIVHQDVIEDILDCMECNTVHFYHVPGHIGDYGNEEANDLAREAC